MFLAPHYDQSPPQLSEMQHLYHIQQLPGHHQIHHNLQQLEQRTQ